MRSKKGVGSQVFMGIFMLPFIAAGLFMPCMLALQYATAWFGHDTSGVIVERTKDDSSEGTTYTVRIKYVPDGKYEEHTVRRTVSREDFEQLKEGARTTVRYLPTMPEISANIPQSFFGPVMTVFLVLFSVFWNFFVLVFFVATVVAPELERSLLKVGHSTRGKIVNRRTDQGGEDQTYHVRYSFSAPTGETVVSEASVTSDQYYKCNVGDPLNIFFSWKNPKSNVALEFSSFEFVNARG